MKIGIIGLGLIGSSLGLALRQRGHQVLGVSRTEPICHLAQARRIVDEASPHFSLLATTEIVFICTPMSAIAPTLESLIPHLIPETIITDVGSVKTAVVGACSPLWHNFVGGHPLAGTERSGIDAAQPDLFKNAPYVLTPTDTTPTESVKILQELITSLGAVVQVCTPTEHDQAVAWISHLPVMISAGLVKTVSEEQDVTLLELAQTLASSGFRDTSRVGGGNPELGVMMAKYNQKALARSLHHYRRNLDQIIDLIEQEQWQSLQQIFEATRRDRSKFLR
jgi:arogenate dehydrogenase (NADP+)